MTIQNHPNVHAKNKKTIGAFEARRKFGQLIEEAHYKKDAFIVERSGRPMAVIMSVDEYQRLQTIAQDAVFHMLDEVWAHNKSVASVKLERDVEKGVEELHVENEKLISR